MEEPEGAAEGQQTIQQLQERIAILEAAALRAHAEVVAQTNAAAAQAQQAQGEANMARAQTHVAQEQAVNRPQQHGDGPRPLKH